MTPSPAHRPMIIAHRGARTEAPENTAAAFDAALKHPIDGIEFDVQLSADGVPVVFHDATLHRIAGSRKRLSSCTLATLRAVDFGIWFDPRFAGEPILTLEEMLDRYAGKTDLYVEVKSYWKDDSAGRTEALVRKTLSCIAARMDRLRARRTYLLSFDAKVLRRAHEIMPAVAGMRNLDRPPGQPMASVTPARLREEIAPAVSAVNLAYRCLSRELAAVVKGRGKSLFTYTCNTQRQVRLAQSVGVDGVMTDKPGWLAQTLAE